MKTTDEIKAAIDVLVRKQGNQGALKLGDVLDDIVDIVQDVIKDTDKFKAQITDVATFQAAVPSDATEIVFAFLGEVDLTGYTKSGSVDKGIDVYVNGKKYAIVSAKIISAPTSCSSMFEMYDSLTSLDFSNFSTENVTNMTKMFYYCESLATFDLSNFSTENVTNMASMFGNCRALTTIIAKDWSEDVASGNMFVNCNALVGGNGTTYDADHTDASYAHIDVADNPGYFTAPA